MEHLIEASLRYFLGTGDRESRVWVFNPDEPSTFLRSSTHFGDERFGIHVIDPYGGLQPFLLNYDALTEEIHIGWRPTAILDTNLVNYLHRYVSLGPAFDPACAHITSAFLRFVISQHLDYNPFFYYVEGSAKDENHKLLDYATAVSRSILLLHTMDEERFLAAGSISTDPAKLALYASEYGAQTIEEIAELHAREMIRPVDPYIDGLSRLIYATLLKIGLIHRSSRRSISAKYNEMLAFMQDVLDVAAGPERMLALGYFAGQFDQFIPLQRGAKADRLLKRLRASAWDLLLLRLPALAQHE